MPQSFFKNKLWVLAAVVVGVLVGIGAYTFRYAEGLSYLSNDPKACMNCHVMSEHYNSWVKSSHRKAATCNDCHVPHDFPMKYIVKAKNGWNHSKAFTLQNFPEPIRITHSNLLDLQNNCIECHKTIVGDIAGHENVARGDARCTECHRSVGHMSLD
jgi:cytochrome c nitrite reductase small subunit